MQVFEQLGRTLRAGKQIAHDQHGPPVTHQLERAGNRTAINFSTSQSLISFLAYLPRPLVFFLTLCLIWSNGVPALLFFRFGFGRIPRRTKTSRMTLSFAPLLRFLSAVIKGFVSSFQPAIAARQKKMLVTRSLIAVRAHPRAGPPQQ